MVRAAAWPVTVGPRPNNAVAYAAGQVYGKAADARTTMVVPPLPANAQLPGFTGAQFWLLQHRDVTQAGPQLNLVLSSQPFATVLADQHALALSDPDIQNLFALASTTAWHLQFSAITAGWAAGAITAGAGTAGRKGVVGSYPLSLSRSPGYFTPGATLGMYFYVAAAYNPIALEAVDVFCAFTVSVKVPLV